MDVLFLLAAAISAAVGGVSTFFSPDFAFRLLGFCRGGGALAILAAFLAIFFASLFLMPGDGAASMEGAETEGDGASLLSPPARTIVDRLVGITAPRRAEVAEEERGEARATTVAEAEVVIIAAADMFTRGGEYKLTA